MINKTIKEINIEKERYWVNSYQSHPTKSYLGQLVPGPIFLHIIPLNLIKWAAEKQNITLHQDNKKTIAGSDINYTCLLRGYELTQIQNKMNTNYPLQREISCISSIP